MRTIEVKGCSLYASMDQGKEYNLAELHLTCGAEYRYRAKDSKQTVVFLGFDRYRGEKKYLFAAFDDGIFAGYFRTNNWGKLLTISHNPVIDGCKEVVL